MYLFNILNRRSNIRFVILSGNFKCDTNSLVGRRRDVLDKDLYEEWVYGIRVTD